MADCEEFPLLARLRTWLCPLIAFVSVLLVSGCSTMDASMFNGYLSEQEREALAREDTREVGVLYVSFDDLDSGPVMHSISGRKLAIQRRGFVRVPLLPGQYRLVSEVDTYGANGTRLSLDAGEALYFRMSPHYAGNGPRLLSESEFWLYVDGLPYDGSSRQIKLESPRSDYLPEPERQQVVACFEQQSFKACESVYDRVPLVLLEPERRQGLVALVESRRKQVASERARQAVEATLPPSVLKDKYLLELRDALARKDFEAAIPLFERLVALDAALDPDFDFFYGEALFETGRAQEAMVVTGRYVRNYGQQANFYQEALLLLNRIEASL